MSLSRHQDQKKSRTEVQRTNSLLAQFATIDIIFYLYMAKNEKLTEKVTQTKEVIKNYVKQK